MPTDNERLLAPDEVLNLAEAGELPARWAMHPVGVGIAADPNERLVLERRAPKVGDAVCLESGGRVTFRRVLKKRGASLVVRCDVAPFADTWHGEVLGSVRPRPIDKLAAFDPGLFTSAGWNASVASAHALSMRRRFLKPPPPVPFTTRELAQSDWPLVRAFWRETCGNELAVEAHAHQHVIGLFDGETLVGANIHLVQGVTSYSAFTLVDKRYRGSGGGSKMIDHAVRVTRAQGLESIYVHIDVKNLPSIAAYRGRGFQSVRWWTDESDPLASAERQWRIFELMLQPKDARKAR